MHEEEKKKSWNKFYSTLVDINEYQRAKVQSSKFTGSSVNEW